MSDFQVRIAVLVIALKDNSVVLARRKNTAYMDGFYGLPGGHLEDNESLVDAARRELYEETGLHPEGEFELFQVYHNASTVGRPYIGFIFRINAWRGVLQLEQDKADDIGEFDINNLPENIISYHREAIEDVLNSSSIKINYKPPKI